MHVKMQLDQILLLQGSCAVSARMCSHNLYSQLMRFPLLDAVSRGLTPAFTDLLAFSVGL